MWSGFRSESLDDLSVVGFKLFFFSQLHKHTPLIHYVAGISFVGLLIMPKGA